VAGIIAALRVNPGSIGTAFNQIRDYEKLRTGALVQLLLIRLSGIIQLT
jgi:hypothetical protein